MHRWSPWHGGVGVHWAGQMHFLVQRDLSGNGSSGGYPLSQGHVLARVLGDSSGPCSRGKCSTVQQVRNWGELRDGGPQEGVLALGHPPGLARGRGGQCGHSSQ